MAQPVLVDVIYVKSAVTTSLRSPSGERLPNNSPAGEADLALLQVTSVQRKLSASCAAADVVLRNWTSATETLLVPSTELGQLIGYGGGIRGP